MKISVQQNDLICNLKYIRICDYAYSYTNWLDNGKRMEIKINDDVFHLISNDNRNCITVYVKTSPQLLFFFNKIKNIEKKIILVTGCSDYSITYEKYYKYKPDNIIKWYAENVEYEIEDLIPLPSGSLSATWIGTKKENAELYNHNDFKFVMIDNKEPKIKNMAFMCFSLETNRHHRKKVYDNFNNKEWVTNLCKEKTGKYLTDDVFIENVYNHHFVISPLGNGLDCGRTWMTLQLGAIPILPYKYCFIEWSKHLPILLYKDINELTEEYLLEKLKEFKSKNYDYDYLKVSYWKDRFENDKNSVNI